MVGTSKDDIHFNYNLSSGSIMAMGTYNIAALRMAFDTEPEECLSCEVHAYTDGVHDKCDYDFHAKFRFPNGAIGEASSTLKGSTYWTPSHVTVTQKEVIVTDETLPKSQVSFNSASWPSTASYMGSFGTGSISRILPGP